MSDLILPMFNSLLIALEGSLLKLFFEESNNNMPASPTTPNLSANPDLKTISAFLARFFTTRS